MNEAPWFRPKAPKASLEDKFTRLPPPISSRTRHQRHFSSPVAFFTRRYKNTDAEKTTLHRKNSGSSRSVTTEESAGFVAVPVTSAKRDQRGTGFLHTRTRSEPVPVMFGSAATRAVTAMPARPPLSNPPAVPQKPQPARRPSESRPPPATASATVAAASRSRAPGVSTNKSVPPTPLVRNASASNSKTPQRSGSASRARPPLENRPMTTTRPVVYVPTPASTHAWISPLTSSEAVGTAGKPLIASRMMQERERGRPPTTGPSGNRSRNTSANRGNKI